MCVAHTRTLLEQRITNPISERGAGQKTAGFLLIPPIIVTEPGDEIFLFLFASELPVQHRQATGSEAGGGRVDAYKAEESRKVKGMPYPAGKVG